jgi:hypothetical protein
MIMPDASVRFWPATVVLETTIVMKAFRVYAENTGKPYDFPDDMASEVIHCFKNARRANMRLDELYMSILTGDYRYPMDNQPDSNLLNHVDATVLTYLDDLSEALMDQILFHNLYDDHGFLPYRHVTPRELGFNCIILKRIEREHYNRPSGHVDTAQHNHF